VSGLLLEGFSKQFISVTESEFAENDVWLFANNHHKSLLIEQLCNWTAIFWLHLHNCS
jgi:hypothetical protein